MTKRLNASDRYRWNKSSEMELSILICFFYHLITPEASYGKPLFSRMMHSRMSSCSCDPMMTREKIRKHLQRKVLQGKIMQMARQADDQNIQNLVKIYTEKRNNNNKSKIVKAMINGKFVERSQILAEFVRQNLGNNINRARNQITLLKKRLSQAQNMKKRQKKNPRIQEQQIEQNLQKIFGSQMRDSDNDSIFIEQKLRQNGQDDKESGIFNIFSIYNQVCYENESFQFQIIHLDDQKNYEGVNQINDIDSMISMVGENQKQFDYFDQDF